MKTSKGRLGTLPLIYRHFLKETIMIKLKAERISIFNDGTILRTQNNRTGKLRN